MSQEDFQIFISYAKPDREKALELFEQLSHQNYRVWIDCKRLLPGQNWDFEITKALEKSAVIIVLISQNSVSRRGYVQKEIKIAVAKRQEKLNDDIYIIPIIIGDEVSVPDELRSVQYISESDPVFFENLTRAINIQIDRLMGSRLEAQTAKEIYWSLKTKKEAWDGLPGYEIEYEHYQFHSERFPDVLEIGKYVEGDLLKQVFEHRAQRYSQAPELFNYGQERWKRTNTLDAHANEPLLTGRVLTLQYSVHWYGAGAAHPNHHFQTYAFVLNPLFLIERLSVIFHDHDNALAAIQSAARQQLLTENVDDSNMLDAEWVNRGTEEWKDFDCFLLKERGIEFLFAPYCVAPYAYGSFSAEVPYDAVIQAMHREYAAALGIEHLARRPL